MNCFAKINVILNFIAQRLVAQFNLNKYTEKSEAVNDVILARDWPGSSESMVFLFMRV